MTVRDILEIMDGGALIYIKKLDAGDYELEGDAIGWRSNGRRGKVIVCTVDREE